MADANDEVEKTSLRVDAAGTQPAAFFILGSIIAVLVSLVFDSPGVPTGFVAERA
jgi:hypothetical protein